MSRRRPWSRGSVAAIAMAALVSSAPAVTAQDASGPGTRTPGKTAASGVDVAEVLIPVKSLDAATKDAEARRKLVTGKPAPVPPADELPGVDFATAERQNRKTAVEHGQTSDGGKSADAQAAPPPIGNEPDPKLLRECFDADDADTDFGRVHNRFTYCNERRAEVRFYWVVNNRRIWRGTNSFTYQIFAQGDNTDRRIRMFSRVKEDTVDYDWAAPWDYFTGRNVRLHLMANCPDDFSLCGASGGSVSMPFVTWDNSDRWFNWDIYGRESAGVGRDKITLNRFRMEFWGEGAGAVVERGNSTPRWTRCDSGTYFKSGDITYPKACVFNEVTPRLTYKMDSDYRSVSSHIYEAQHFPNRTYPTLVPDGMPQPRDKKIPGRYDAQNPAAPGLHRITEELHPSEYKENGNHKDGACYKKGPHKDLYADTGLPTPPNTPAEQCDEYPFASTLEGAAHPEWDFSVKAVPQRDNSIAGGLLGSYYNDDRILAWDPELPAQIANDRFYVHIE
ncbi:NucA/NucB deoxyribonuclease domain-containing protein [Streptomyces sp. A1499]|nr:NucA/NucB deoxyribonuclease domain-containing protein [Streptomyces sp. A1499]